MMRKNYKPVLLALFLAIIIFVFYKLFVNSEKKESTKEVKVTAIDVSDFYDEELFYKGLKESEKTESIDDIKALVIPHHLLASHMIAKGIKYLPKDRVSTIIFIGPNHYESGNSKFLTSSEVWYTPFGSVFPNINIINQLKNSEFVSEDTSVFYSEHSIAGILPFIKNILPEVKIVPLILKQEISINEIKSVSDIISEVLKKEEDVFIMVTTDFSHNLTSAEANKNDIETIKALEKADYNMLLSYKNDHIDSPASVMLLIKSLEMAGKYEMKVMEHTNSAILLKQEVPQTTSYYSIVFTSAD